MELEKITKSLQNTTLKIERAYIEDIIKITTDIFQEYDINYKNTNIAVNKQVFINKFKSIFRSDTKSNCMAITKNGNRCTRRTYDEQNYCKTHYHLTYRNKNNDNDLEHNFNELTDDTIFVIQKDQTTNVAQQDLQLKFINDSFYYIDQKYIYDKTDLTKVGYIHKDEYILTDDPFVLN